MFCTKCGVENPADAEFCYKCGRPLFTAQPDETNQPAATRRTPLASTSDSLEPASGHEWATAYGWLFVLTALYLWIVGLMTFSGGNELTPAALPFGNEKSIGVGAALFQALLFGATGLTIIRRKKMAVMLVWVSIALSALGILLRGLIPLDILLWTGGLGLAIWYTKKASPLLKAAQPQVTSEPLAGRTNPWLDGNGIGLVLILVVAILFLVSSLARWSDRRSTSQLTGRARPQSDQDIFGAGKGATLPPIKQNDLPLLRQPAADSALPPLQRFDSATSRRVQPCPSGIPTDTKVLLLNSVDAALSVSGSEAKAWFDPKDHWVDYTTQQWADHGYGETGYDLGQWHFSFKVSNETKVDRPELKFDGYCLASLAYEIEIESNDGTMWKGTGKFNFDPPLSPGWSQELRELSPSLGSRPKDGNLINWRITKAWGFALDAKDRAGLEMIASPAPKKGALRIRVDGNVQAAKLISQPRPDYPVLARQTRIQGTVRLDAVIGNDGAIKNLALVSGHPLLIRAAMDAVKQWRYRPTILNGFAVEVATTVDVNFTLSQ